MQIKDIFSTVYKLIIDIILYTTIIVVVLGLLPESLFTDFSFKPTQFDTEHLFHGIGKLTWNDHLMSKASRIGEGHLYGPESMAEVGDYIYTGLADGRLVRVHKTTGKIQDVLRFLNSNNCANNVYFNIRECGRPLGIRYHTDKYLYVVEAETGLYRVNVTDHSKQLLSKNFATLARPVIFNDLVFDPVEPNLVYISVSNSNWDLIRIAYSIMEHSDSGYVLALDMKSGKLAKVTEGHTMTNGLELSADQKSLLIAETGNFVIKKVELTKAREAFKSGTALRSTELPNFTQLLPGEPDNIRLDPTTGDLVVGMFTARPSGKLLRDYLSNWPFVRKALARTAYSLYLLFDFVEAKYYPSEALRELCQDLYSGHFLYKSLPQKDGAVMKLDGKTGEFKSILGSSKFNSISEAMVTSNGDLYFGSFRNQFMGRIPKGSH